jgi:hypothetical protein
MTGDLDNQANPPKNRKIDIVIIGDIVFDKITIDEKNEDLLERDSCGGALFVKTFFEAHPCIAESSNIYGYQYTENPNNIPNNKFNDILHEAESCIKESSNINDHDFTETSNDEPDNKNDDKPEKSPNKILYNKIIQKTINLIPLNKQKTVNSGNAAYRMQGPITKLKDDKGSVTLSFPSISPDQENNNLQFLVVTDLGISTNSDQNNDKQSATNQDPVWIGNRKIELEEASKEEEHEWIHHLRRAYDINHNLDSGSMPWHFVTISNPTDKLFESSSYSYLKNHNDTLNGQEELFNDEEISVINKKTLAILFGDHLRSRCNLAIARRISIERTAQDFLQELHTNPLLMELGNFEHLIVRFGLLAVVHSYRIKDRRFHRLFFDPENIYKPEYSTKLSGGVTGTQTLLLDNIIKQLLVLADEEKQNPYDVAESIGMGIKLGIVCCRRRYDKGYGSNPEKALDFLQPNSIQKSFYGELDNLEDVKKETLEAAYAKEAAAIKDEARNIADERIPIAHPTWSILAQSAEYKLVQAAENIVYKGVDKALNFSKEERDRISATDNTQINLDNIIWSPIGLFGIERKQMIVLERYELESYRSVQLLMEEVMNLKNKSILSIAVFGPPGSGKSFVSERIADSACEASRVTPVLKKINLASITESSQLNEKIEKVFSEFFQQYELFKNDREDETRSKVLQLIIFFDEFDCPANDKVLGWLKTFLPMMQDGEFTTQINTHKPNYSTYHHQPILIFAGGTSHTYSNFSRQDAAGDPEDQLRFAQAKGPDFVSRLRGHIDILGPSKTSEHDEGYVVRRAILLRTAFLNQFPQISAKGSLKDFIYRPFVRAMLTVSRYKHGARSMEAIIAMCAKLPGDRISSASMPTHAQLNMHVDANEFLKIVRTSS